MKVKLYSKLFFVLLLCSFPNLLKAQINITTADTSICEGYQFQLHADLNGRTPVPINFQQNNVFSGVINLGFSFVFYGTAYTQCIVSPNGQISFNTGSANMPADNVVDEAVPGETSTLNSIMCPWIGLDITAGGTIDYAQMGTAPNRRFVLTFCSVPMFTCTNYTVSFQVVLYETSNQIDMHLIRNPGPQCSTWNFGRSIQGVQDAAGINATTVPGRNWPFAWGGTEDSHRFSPAGPNSYTVAAIPHTHIPDQTSTIRWYAGGFQIGTGANYQYTYISSQTIVAMVYNCPDTLSDTVDVTVNQIYNITSVDSTNPSQCEAPDGTITLFGFFPNLTYDIFYTDVLGNPQTLTATADNAGGLLITGLVAGNYTNFYVVSQEGCTSNVYTPIPLYDDAVFIDTAVAVFPILCNANDGSITLQGLVPGVTYTVNYLYNSTPFTVVLVADANGDVNIPNLASGTYTNITASTTNCTSNAMGPLTLIDPIPVIDDVIPSPPSLCRGSDGYLTITGMFPDSNYVVRYLFEGVVYTVPLVANGAGEVIVPGLSAGLYDDITVQLLSCQSNQAGPVTIVNPAITADFTFALLPGCTEDTVMFTDISQGSAYPFEYVWKFGDGTTDTAQHPMHIYDEQATYPVTLIITDSVCIDSVTHDVIINHPLLANFTVDFETICQNGTVNFTDASTATPPTTYYWDFGNGETNSFGVPTVASVYPHPGDYTAMLVVTDFIGCKDTAYKDIRVDSLTVITADFKDDMICAGEEIVVFAGYADTGSTGVNWDFGDGIIKLDYGHDMQHAYENAGVYNLHIIATGRVCDDVDSTYVITVQPNPQINLGPDTSLCPGSGNLILMDLVNAGNPAASWKWLLGDAQIDGTSFNQNVTEPGRYTSIVTIGACSAVDTILVEKGCYVDVPNAFSPDGDSRNDYFIPRQLSSKNVKTFKMQIFNRWGQEIFLTTDIGGRGWDGRFNGEPQPQGVYIYLIDVSFANGVVEKKQGNVTLLR